MDPSTPTSDFAPPFTILPATTHTQTIILLHGRNSTGPEFASDFLSLTPTLSTTESNPNFTSSASTIQSLLLGVKFIFPTTPPLHSLIFQEPLTQWFDISSLTDPDSNPEIQYPGMKRAVEYVLELVRKEAEISPTGDVLLGGISQGFVIALLTVLVGGGGMGKGLMRALFGFCGWLPLRGVIEEVVHRVERGDGNGGSAAEETRREVASVAGQTLGVVVDKRWKYDVVPIYLGHSVDDGVVDVQHGRDMCRILTDLGYPVDWNEFEDGEHWIQEPLGVDTLLDFFRRNGILTKV